MESDKQIHVPSDLNSSISKLVYVYVQSLKEVTVDTLCSDLNLQKLAVLPILSRLSELGYINRRGELVLATRLDLFE